MVFYYYNIYQGWQMTSYVACEKLKFDNHFVNKIHVYFTNIKSVKKFCYVFLYFEVS